MKYQEQYQKFAREITSKFMSMMMTDLPIQHSYAESADGPVMIQDDVLTTKSFIKHNEICVEWLSKNMLKYDDWVKKNIVTFTENDIHDKERLERMVEKEAAVIFNSPSARKDRDYDTVKFCVKQGKVAELYLIENFGYEEADKKYHDLKDPISGEYAEVKAYSIHSADVPAVKRDLKRLRTENWNISKWYYLFKYSEGNYELLEKIKVK